MNSTQRVINALQGKPVDRQPIYGWVFANMAEDIRRVFGSVEAFEDHYAFDIAHIFGGPSPYRWDKINFIRKDHEELTPDLLLEKEIFTDPDQLTAYENVAESICFHKRRERFCYVQTPGFFESFNDVFGIENQLLWMVLYPEELKELYRRQAQWNIRFADHCIDLGANMIHISDDWGSQRDLLFSPQMWWEYIYPNMKQVVNHIHERNCFASLHSDGCILRVVDGIKKLELDLVHPWQESAGMGLNMYLENCQEHFALMGGICVQTALGMMNRDALENEIRRVFGKLRNKRWVCCTSHFVQNHCSVEDLIFAYDLIYQLARE